MMRHGRLAIVLMLGWLGMTAWAETPDQLLAKLQPRGYVSDYAGVFSTQQLAEAEGYLVRAKQSNSIEIAIVVLPSLEGGEINDMANRLFSKWGIGKKGTDNGILLLTAVEDRKVRIEVGYGLEGIITDARAGRILDEHIIPRFREGHMADGLLDGARALVAIVRNDESSSAAESSGEKNPAPGGLLVPIIFIGTFIGIIILVACKGKRTPPGSGGSGHRLSSSGGMSSSSSSHSFGGGSSGGGGASRSW